MNLHYQVDQYREHQGMFDIFNKAIGKEKVTIKWLDNWLWAENDPTINPEFWIETGMTEDDIFEETYLWEKILCYLESEGEFGTYDEIADKYLAYEIKS